MQTKEQREEKMKNKGIWKIYWTNYWRPKRRGDSEAKSYMMLPNNITKTDINPQI